MRCIVLSMGLMMMIAPMPAAAFSVRGKKGQFLVKQVVSAELAQADQTLNDGTTRGLLGKSIDRGELQGIGLNMPRTQDKLKAMLNEIRAAWSGGAGAKWQLRDPGPITIRILATDDYLAKVKPDNVMLISLGLLRQGKASDDPTVQFGAGAPKTDDEIYWVLAHEFAHIGLAHFAKNAKDIKAKADLDKMTSGITLLGDIAQVKVEKVGDQLRLADRNDPKTREATDKAWLIANKVRESVTLVFNALDLNLEDEADAAAVDIAHAMNLNEAGFSTALDRTGLEDDSRKKRAKEMGATMKSLLWPSQNFLEILKVPMQNFFQSGKIDFSALASAYGKDVLRNLAPTAFSAARTQLTRSHRDFDDRKKGLDRYRGEAKILDGGRDLDDSRLKAIWADQEFKDADILVGAIGKANEALAQARYADALAAMQVAVGTSFADTPAMANMMGRILNGMDKLDEAEAWYDRAAGMGQTRSSPTGRTTAVTPQVVSRALARGAAAARRPPAARPARNAPARPAVAPVAAAPPPPRLPADPYFGQSVDGFQAHVDLLIRARKFARALIVIAETKRRFGDDDGFLPKLVQIHTLTNNAAQLVATLTRCEQLQSQKVAQQCFGALGRDADGKDQLVLSAADREKMNNAITKLGDVARMNTEKAKPEVEEEEQN